MSHTTEASIAKRQHYGIVLPQDFSSVPQLQPLRSSLKGTTDINYPCCQDLHADLFLPVQKLQ